MANGIIVGAVGVLVRPIAKGMNKTLAGSLSGAPAAGEKAGRAMGRSMERAFSASKPVNAEKATKNLERAQDNLAAHTERTSARQRKAQQDVAAARKNVADVAASSSERVQKAQSSVEAAETDLARVVEQSARDQEAAKRKLETAEADLGRVVEQSARDQEAAKRRVDAAQADYNATIEKYGAESSQAQAAANRLADAEDALAKTVSDGASRQERAKDAVAAAQDRLAKVTEDGAAKQERAQAKVTDAQEAYSRAIEQSGKDSDAARKAADDLAIAEENLKTAAMEAAQGHEVLQAEVDQARRALDEAERSSKGLGRVWQGTKDFGADYKGMGDRLNRAIGPKVWTGVKWGALGAAGAIGGTLLASLKKGWDRLTAIENAEAKLSGLGHSAETVETVMDNALASVKGTAFGLGEAASAAAAAVAAGVEPGKELESYLSLVGDAATIAGTGIDEMGAIFGKVMSSGKVQGDIFNQLERAGIAIVPMLSEALGVSAEEVRRLGSAGEISSEDFLKAMGSMEGAALKGGDTAQGAIANLGAAMGRFGAALLEHVFPLVQPLMASLTEMFDYLSDKAGPVVENLVDGFKEWVNTPGVQAFLEGVRDVAVALYEKALRPLGEWIGQHWKPIAAALGGLVAYFGGAMLVAAISAVGSAIGALSIPVTAIGAAVAAVVGALGYFFTQTEIGQAIISKAWEGIKRVVAGVADFFVTTVWPALLTGWDILQTVVLAVWNDVLSPVFTALADLALQVWNGVVVPAFQQFVGYMRDTVMPIIQQLWTDYIQPVFLAIGGLAVWLWQNAIKPAVSAIASFWSDVLGPVIVWFWQKIVLPAFSAIGSIIAGAVTGVIFPILDGLGWLFTNVVAPVVMWLWRNVFAPAFEGIKLAVQMAVEWIANTGWPWLQQAWNAIADAATWLYEKVIQPIWTGIRVAIAIAVTAVVLAMDLLVWTWQNVVAPVLRWLNEKVVQPVWSAIRGAIDAVVTWFRDTAWPIFSAVIELLRMHFNALRVRLAEIWAAIHKRVIQPVVTWFRDTAWPIIDSVLESIKRGFRTMRDVLKAAWNYVKDRVINPVATWFRDTVKPLFDTATSGIEDAFEGMKNAVKKSWEALRDTAKVPVEFVVDKIINKAIIGTYNDVADGIFGLDPISDVKLPAGWRKGGILPGYTPMHRGDDVLTPMRSGEGVLVSEGLRDRESRSAFLAANEAAKRGASFADYMRGVAGYASGGLVKLGMPFRGSYPRGDGFNARGGRHKGIDWAMPTGTPLVAVAPGTANRTHNAAAGNKMELRIGNGLTAGYHHLSRFALATGANASLGQTVGYAGSTGRSTGPHLHFSLKKDGTYVDPMPYLGAGGAAGSGDDGGGWWNPFSGIWDSIKEQLRDGVGDSKWGDMLFEVPKKILDGAITWATDKLAGVGDFASDVVTGAAGRARWSPVMTRALTMKGQFGPRRLKWGLDRLMQESSGDPNVVNNWDSNARRGTPSKGLMQVIGPTFRSYAEPGYSSNILDPLSNILASINYTLATYGSLKAGWTRSGGYSDGGIVEPPTLFDSGGILPPGITTVLNASRKPEAVLTNDQVKQLRIIASRRGDERGGDTFIGHGYTPEEIARAWRREEKKREALYAR